MALKIHMTKKIKGVTFKSGLPYSFSYSHWHHDPHPLVIFLYAFSGTHPSTGRQWRFMQAINVSYLPRRDRKRFVRVWKDELIRNNGKVEFTWPLVQNQFPYLEGAVRRYFYTPSYMINNVKAIPIEDMEQAIVSTWAKDFSKKLRMDLAQKFQRPSKGEGALSKIFKKMMGMKR